MIVSITPRWLPEPAEHDNNGIPDCWKAQFQQEMPSTHLKWRRTVTHRAEIIVRRGKKLMDGCFSYFNEDYFERGSGKGTVYNDYARNAAFSPTYREIAEALYTIFRPLQCLEIGCATGAIVRHLNELGADAYGIDVSEWAVKNKLHDNVILAGVQELPFATNRFDLVFSCHSLEHIPPIFFKQSLDEMARVASPAGYQFHMLPIIGAYPYKGDRDAVKKGLQADPTHNILEDMDWWLKSFEQCGWVDVPITIFFRNDTDLVELSACQFTLSHGDVSTEIIRRAFAWNQGVHRDILLEVKSVDERQSSPSALSTSLADITGEISTSSAPWQDVKRIFDTPTSFYGGVITLLVELQSAQDIPLRVALIDDTDPNIKGVFEFWITTTPGVFSSQIHVSKFRVLSGNPNLNSINSFYFGGNLNGASLKISATLKKCNGEIVHLV